MTVTLMTVKLYAPHIHSLKEKRMIVKSLCERLQNKFHVSVIESEAQDRHQTIVLAVVYLAHTAAIADSTREAIEAFIEGATDAQVVAVAVEHL